MNVMKPSTYFLLLCLLLQLSLSAQILSTRNVIALPEVDSSATKKLFHQFDFSGEISTGGGSFEEEMAWSYKMMGLLDIYRFSPNTSISFLMAHELNANPHNDIAFNPRKAIWEENIRFYKSRASSAWMVGIFHRCKHDIDNADPPREGVAVPTYIPQNRVIILNGINAGYFLSTQFKKTTLYQQLLAEYYIYTEDSRSPFPGDRATWNELLGALRYTANAEYDLSKYLDLRIGGSLSAAYLETSLPTSYSTLNLDYRIEFCLVHNASSNAVELFSSFERLFDDVGFVTPNATEFWSIGLRFRPASFR